MKHIRIAFLGLALIAGIPWILIATDQTPFHALRGFWSRDLVSLQDRLVSILVMLIWFSWLWTLVSVVVELWSARRTDSVLSGRNRLAALFVASLWSLLITSRGSTDPTNSIETVVEEESSPKGKSVPWTAIASVQSILIAEYMLRRFSEERFRVARRLTSGCEVAPLSRTSEFFWRSLRIQVGDVSPDQINNIPVGIDSAGHVISAEGPVMVVGADHEDDSPVREHLELAVEALGESAIKGQPISLIRDTHGWKTATGERVRPFALSEDDKHSYSRLMSECRGVREVSSPARAVPGDWLICVRLLGPIEARWADDSEVAFRKSKPLELLTWLVTHPDRPTRGAARTAMWMIDVQSSYFNNVVSELRTVIGSAGFGEERDLLEKSSQDRLILSERVVSDADILRIALERFRNAVTNESRVDLRAALSLVRNLPFAGSDYLWPDPEGITSNLVHLVMSASIEFAEDAVRRNDVDDVYFATDKGLRMFPGDEELLTLRAAVARQAQSTARGGKSG